MHIAYCMLVVPSYITKHCYIDEQEQPSRLMRSPKALHIFINNKYDIASTYKYSQRTGFMANTYSIIGSASVQILDLYRVTQNLCNPKK